MYKVIITSDLRKNSKIRSEIKKCGFNYKKEDYVWINNKIEDKQDLKHIKQYCKKNNLKYQIDNIDFERSSTYRKTFFNKHKGIHNCYMCAYCGEFHKKNEITVDHIIPVHSAKNNKFVQFLLKLVGIENINDIKNLTPACSSCNSRKGTHVAGWIIRGFLGKYQPLWILRILVQFSIFYVINYTIIYYVMFNKIWFCTY